MILKKSKLMATNFDSYVNKLDGIYSTLLPYSDFIDVYKIKQLEKNFIEKTEEFFSSEKKLNIAALGQVKAGKSSFLNALIFDNKEILPSDAAPKTATLTKIEYSEINQIVVDFYNYNEWQALLSLSQSAIVTPAVKAAKEIEEAVIDLGIDPLKYVKDTKEIISFDKYEDLIDKLNDYVGKNGKFTPLVKSVTLKLNLDELKFISIVDTPGLNDPIKSRTEKTKQYIEKCDVAFFLSRSSYFLDKTDLTLLTTQLPQKGIKKLCLIASQFDSALMDSVYDYDSLDEAILETKAELRRHAMKSVDDVILQFKKEKQSEYICSVVENCRRPVFMSVIADDMSKKSVNDYNDQEKAINKILSEDNGDLSSQQLFEIGNMEEIRNIFSEIIEEKDNVLEEKAKSFIIIAESELLEIFKGYEEEIKREIKNIRDNLISEDKKKKQEKLSLVNEVKQKINSCFEKYLSTSESGFVKAYGLLEGFKREYSTPQTKKEINVKNEVKNVSDSVFYKPWTWGKSHNEYSVSKTSTAYIDPEDCCKGISSLSDCAKQVQSVAFSHFEDITELKKEIFTIFDKYVLKLNKSTEYKKLRQKLDDGLKYINISVSAYDVSPFIQRIRDKYPKKIVAQIEQKEFSQFSSGLVENLLNEIYRKYDDDKEIFKDNVNKIQNDVCRIILENQIKELSLIGEEIRKKERAVNKMTEALETINRYL